MSEYQKSLLIKDIIKEVDSIIASDESHKTRMNRLWKTARKSGFAGGVDSIKDAYLSRAKSLIPSVVSKAKTRLNGSDGVKSENTENLSPGGSTSSGSGKRTSPQDGRKVDWSKYPDDESYLKRTQTHVRS